MSHLFSERAREVILEIDGTIMLAQDEGRLSTVETAAVFSFLEQKHRAIAEADLTEAAEEDAWGSPPPPEDGPGDAQPWKQPT